MTLSPLAQRNLAALGLPTYRSLAEFYATSEAREKSGEVDFGYHWCIDASRFPNWRVSYVEDTREVYGLLLNTGDTTVVLLARGPDRDAVEFALSGWENRDRPSLQWAADQLAEWRPDGAAFTIPVFENSTSPLTMSNDGRVRLSSSDGKHTLSIDGHPTWHTEIREVADAFIAGWDAYMEGER
jgi:hypothetical protein